MASSLPALGCATSIIGLACRTVCAAVAPCAPPEPELDVTLAQPGTSWVITWDGNAWHRKRTNAPSFQREPWPLNVRGAGWPDYLLATWPRAKSESRGIVKFGVWRLSTPFALASTPSVRVGAAGLLTESDPFLPPRSLGIFRLDDESGLTAIPLAGTAESLAWSPSSRYLAVVEAVEEYRVTGLVDALAKLFGHPVPYVALTLVIRSAAGTEVCRHQLATGLAHGAAMVSWGHGVTR